MTDGRDLLRGFDAQRQEIEAGLAQVTVQRKHWQGRVDALSREQAGLRARIAAVRLDALDAEQLRSGLSDADRRALDAFERRDAELARVESELARNREQEAGIRARRAEAADTLDAAREAWKQRFETIRMRLAAGEAWPALVERAAELKGQAERVRARLAQAEADRQDKRRGYEADPLFHYLWRRDYGRAGYARGGLVRALDGWVAGLCDYPAAARNYTALMALPERLAEHAGRIERQLAEVAAEGRALEEQAIAEDGALPLREAMEAAQRALDALDEALERNEREEDAFEERRNAVLAPDNEFRREAEAAMREGLAFYKPQQLARMAAATDSGLDDAAAGQLERVERELEQAHAELLSRQGEAETLLQRRQRLDEAREKFRRKRYDSRSARYRGLDFEGLLLGYLLGRIGSGDFHRSIERAHSWSGGGGGSSFGGFGGGGGFSSGGGFGGGGFSTGGGF